LPWSLIQIQIPRSESTYCNGPIFSRDFRRKYKWCLKANHPFIAKTIETN
jgi:hypothetical protein